MVFTLAKSTLGGFVLLRRDLPEPVARSTRIFLHGKPVGKVLQTIGAVTQPWFVAKLDKPFPAGTEFE